MSKKVNSIISIVLFIIIIICLTKIIDKNYKYYKADKTYEDIRNIKINSLNAEENGESIQVEKLKGINSDYKLWINIPNTVIDYPVVQGKDNEFYLENNFYNEPSIAGTIFLDYGNDVLNDKNLILYGHNMRNGSMFADINKFKEKEFFDNGIIKINKDSKEYVYEIFSVFIESGNNINLKNSFMSDEEFNEYVNNLKEKSMYSRESENTTISSIITLYTCSYEFDEARTIVCASLIE